MASVQRIFPRLNTPAVSFIRHPAGVLGAWDQTALVYSGQGARYIGPFQGAAQIQAVPAFAAVPMATAQVIMIAQLLGDPLRAATIPAGNWSIGFALQLANAGAMFVWGGVAALFVVDGLTGERRATIFDVSAVGSNGRTVTTERTCLASIAGFGVQLRTGDFLCLEIGMEVNNAAAALVSQASLFADGSGPITVDDIAATSAGSVLEAPVELLLSLPQPGEQPTASVSHAEAVRLLKEHWPPFSETLYDWDDPATTVHGFMEALGDVIKVYGFDQSDRLVREVNTLLTVELLPFWEGALGIVLSAAAMRSRTADQRRQVVIARLREVGPLTLFALAAIFGQLASYAPGTTPEVLELDATTERTHNEYTDSIPNAIPIGTGFDATNLIRITPTLLDGGRVWDTGALVTLNLSSANSAGLHVQLTAPDFSVTQWDGGPDLATSITLRSPAPARGPTHGNWTLNVYRDTGAPAVTLNSWKLYMLGRDWGGRAQSKFIWSVYLDAMHQLVDRRDIDTTLDRITQSYCQSFAVFSKTSLPGATTTRAGRFIPGA